MPCHITVTKEKNGCVNRKSPSVRKVRTDTYKWRCRKRELCKRLKSVNSRKRAQGCLGNQTEMRCLARYKKIDRAQSLWESRER